MISQSVELALECQEAFSDIQTRNNTSVDKLASVEEELRWIKTETEEIRSQQAEEGAKLETALAQIEALKSKVYES